MLKLFENIHNQLDMGKSCMLVTIVEAKGSSPRSAGAYMLVNETGRIYGTIGGGNLEYQATFKAQDLLAADENALVDYDLSNSAAANLGMICGGRTKVLFRCLGAEDLPFVETVQDLIARRKMYYLLLPLAEGRPQVREELPIDKRQLGYEEEGISYYAEQFNYDGRVYLYGGGHLTQELVPLLTHVGFRCIVADDRAEFSRRELFPDAEEVKLVDYCHLDEPVGEEDYIVIATRGHLGDTDCMRFALNTKAKYIGVVGSRKKVKIIREKLTAEGFTEADMDRLTTPIGISIGSETPAEIAVSIGAQLIQVRAGK